MGVWQSEIFCTEKTEKIHVNGYVKKGKDAIEKHSKTFAKQFCY